MALKEELQRSRALYLKSIDIRILLLTGQWDRANALYTKGLFFDVMITEELLQKNIPTLPSSLPLIKELKTHMFAEKNRQTVLFTCISIPQALPTINWWFDQMEALPLEEQLKTSDQLRRGGLLGTCYDKNVGEDISLVLAQRIPFSFWADNLKNHFSSFEIWMSEQEQTVVGVLVQRFKESGLPQDHPFFEFHQVVKYFLEEQTQEISDNKQEPKVLRKM